ncbi:hypothetical protein FRC08_003010 [Ceratobasidium sp. 394]|nr:hypothetical protein FRC08_003010 [Ceratobasidium sp. 394]
MSTSTHYLTVSRVTKDFRHLTRGPRFQQRSRSPSIISSRPTFPKPSDRIKYWNIVPGDFVRVVRGANADNQKREVLSIDKTRNLVNVKGITRSRGSDDNKARVSKPIHYSNLQLFVGAYEFPAKGGEEPKTVDVYATRLSTSTPFYLPAARRWVWSRYAAGTSPELPTPEGVAPRKNRTKISWPDIQKRLPPTVEFDYDTAPSVVKEITWKPADISQYLLYPPYFHIPAPESQQRITPEQKELAARARAVQDAYIRGENDASVPMEQYLARELANPHSRARKQERWQNAKEERDRLRVRFMRAAKEARSMGGSTTSVGLNLTKTQAAREGAFLFEAHVRKAEKARRLERAVQRGAVAKLARKKARKARKAAKREEALRNLVLESAPNQVLPPASV